jgi:hypothetical protein
MFYMNNRWKIPVNHKQKRDYVACPQENSHLSMNAHHLHNMDVKMSTMKVNFRIVIISFMRLESVIAT